MSDEQTMLQSMQASANTDQSMLISIDTQKMIHDYNVEMENIKHKNQTDLENNRSKLELIRLARDVLMENSRSKPVDSREVTVNDIKNFAAELKSFID